MPVDTSAFGEKFATLLDQVISGTVAVILMIIIAGVIIAVILYVRHLKKFNIKVEVWSSRSGGTRGQGETYKILKDKGGMFYSSKDQSWWFRLHRHKVDMPNPPYEVMMIDEKGNNMIKIWQKSHNEFFYLMPFGIDTLTVLKDGKLYPIGQVNMKVVEGDVAYWGQIRKRQDRKLFDTESLIMKLLPYIVPVLMFMLVIFMTYMITEHWGEFTAAAKALEQAAQALKSATTATVTTGG